MALQLYVRAGSPASSAPRVESAVVAAVTTPGEAAAGVAMVGAEFPAEMMTTDAVPDLPDALALTV
jgi:hypothetical protein